MKYDDVRGEMRLRMDQIVERYLCGREPSRKKRKPLCQHWRRAHWRNVACGKQWGRHRRRWIDGYRAGDPNVDPCRSTLAKWLREGLVRGIIGERRAA